MLTCASSREILVAPPPKFFSTNTNGTSDTDYSEDKKAISGRVFTKDQIRKVHAFAQPRPRASL